MIQFTVTSFILPSIKWISKQFQLTHLLLHLAAGKCIATLPNSKKKKRRILYEAFLIKHHFHILPISEEILIHFYLNWVMSFLFDVSYRARVREKSLTHGNVISCEIITLKFLRVHMELSWMEKFPCNYNQIFIDFPRRFTSFIINQHSHTHTHTHSNQSTILKVLHIVCTTLYILCLIYVNETRKGNQFIH